MLSIQFSQRIRECLRRVVCPYGNRDLL